MFFIMDFQRFAICDKHNRTLRICLRENLKDSLSFFIRHAVQKFVNQQYSRIYRPEYGPESADAIVRMSAVIRWHSAEFPDHSVAAGLLP
jgi:hypothetical protein